MIRLISPQHHKTNGGAPKIVSHKAIMFFVIIQSPVVKIGSTGITGKGTGILKGLGGVYPQPLQNSEYSHQNGSALKFNAEGATHDSKK